MSSLERPSDPCFAEATGMHVLVAACIGDFVLSHHEFARGVGSC